MINRNIGIVVPGVAVPQKVFTCSTGDVLSGAAITGRIIDRLGLGSNRIFGTAEVGINAYTTVGSTDAIKKVALSVKLQHGDSSGGGDMADYSTGMQNDDQNFFTSADTTTLQNWSTGVLHLNHQSWYEITAAKRYIRAVGYLTKGGPSTSTAAGSIDHVWANLVMRLGGADHNPSVSSTSTSTSTST